MARGCWAVAVFLAAILLLGAVVLKIVPLIVGKIGAGTPVMGVIQGTPAQRDR